MTSKLCTCQTGNQECSLLFTPITLPSLQPTMQFILFASPWLFPLTPGSCQAYRGEILQQPSPTESARGGAVLTPSRPAYLLASASIGSGVGYALGGSLDTLKLPLPRALFNPPVPSQLPNQMQILPLPFIFLLPPAWPRSPFLLLSLPHRAFYQLPLCRSPQTIQVQFSLSAKHNLDHFATSSEAVSVFSVLSG